MLLFLVLSGVWLVAAGTARVWYHGAPSRFVFPSPDEFYVWLGIGIVGVILTLVSLVQKLWARSDKGVEGPSRQTR